MKLVPMVAALAILASCGMSSSNGDGAGVDTAPDAAADTAPSSFTIVPDDYDVPYAGTAEDGRKFFLSDELFHGDTAFVGLFLWHADGTFDEVRVSAVARPEDAPIGQAVPAPQEMVDARLLELGNYKLEPITVEPFVTKVDGVRFGWHVGRYDDGTYYINIVPGDFIAYYAPWDGLEYDT